MPLQQDQAEYALRDGILLRNLIAVHSPSRPWTQLVQRSTAGEKARGRDWHALKPIAALQIRRVAPANEKVQLQRFQSLGDVNAS